jgi:hypothetical protein
VGGATGVTGATGQGPTGATGPLGPPNPGAEVRNKLSPNIPNNTTTAFPFGTLIRDDANFWDTTNNTKLTAPSTGWYAIGACLIWQAEFSTGGRITELRLNGTTYFPNQACNSSPVRPIEQTCFLLYYCTAGDYFEVTVYQNQGATVPIAPAVFYMIKLP